DGQAVAATDPGDVGESFRREPWFRQAGQSGEAIAGPSASARYGRTVLHIAAEIFHPENPGEAIGFIAVGYDWKGTGNVLARTRQKRSAFGLNVDLLLLDERSTVIGGSWNSQLGNWR